MKGITEERLKQYLTTTIWCHRTLAELLKECTELNPWKPIDESTPKDRPVNIYDKGYGQQKVQWNEFYKCFTDFHGHKYLNPTHFCELPEDPK